MAKVGIVVIAHSRALAEGVAEVARAMGVGRVRVEAAGGTADGGLGTSIELLERAVRAVDDGHGVLLLADIGSSVITARLFIEDAEYVDDLGTVVLADAPVVEGAVAAASLAAAGADLGNVKAAAEDAYHHRKLDAGGG